MTGQNHLPMEILDYGFGSFCWLLYPVCAMKPVGKGDGHETQYEGI